MARIALTAYAVGLLALSALNLVAPQRNGLLAISQIFAPHLFLPLVVLVPLVLARARPAVRAVLVAAAVVGIARFAPGMLSLPVQPTAGAQPVTVMSWNLAAGEVAGQLLVEKVLASGPDIVGLQELRPEHAATIESNTELTTRYPYRVVEPHAGVLGMALLSSLPITDSRSSQQPPLIVATVDIGGTSTTVATAHPLPARIQFLAGIIPIGYEASARDQSLAEVRAAVAAHGSAPLVLLGDFNVTDREPAYVELTDGLLDAHAEVGLGPGSTWRPPTADVVPFGVLRIDYVFTGNGAQPLSIAVDCVSNAGDHCIVTSVVEVP